MKIKNIIDKIEEILLPLISVMIIVLASLVLIIISIGLFIEISLPIEKRFTRKNIHSIEAKRDVDAMMKAMGIMRKMPCDNPLSWYYQSAIHWVPDSIPNNSLCESYHTIADKKVAWNNCTHSPSSKEKIHFLVWHRLYIYHFEKIVRKLSGYSEFALPYWGYTNKSTKDKFLHPAFRTSSSSLYEACRFDSLNSGFPMQGEIERSLDLTKLMTYTDFYMFSNAIDIAPHGAIHDYVGHGNDTTEKRFKNPITGTITPDGLMGSIRNAGFDPVFWTHHSNIDRIWQQWTNSENGRYITIEDLKSIPWDYVFFDEHGRKVVYTPEKIIQIIYNLDYEFDDIKIRPNNKVPRAMTTQAKEILKKVGVNVNGNTTNFKIDMPLQSSSSNSKKVLCKITVSFTKKPRGVYEVYANLPNGISPHPSHFSFGGFMTFFGSDHKMKEEGCEGGCCRKETRKGRTMMSFQFEINKAESYYFSIYKHNGLHASDLSIESVSIK